MLHHIQENVTLIYQECPIQNIPGVVCTTQVKGWMDEERMLEWIQRVWTPYVVFRSFGG